jgi:tRNA threonylcarbamoyladenosine biosynthesis protein TsaE
MSRTPLPDEAATAALARRLAAAAAPRQTYLLTGDLGSGKTTFVRHFLRQCGVQGEVPSPTFNLVLSYAATLPSGQAVNIWHVDLYRLEDPEELVELGLDEAMAEGIVFVEWPALLEQVYDVSGAIRLRFGLDGDNRWVEAP